MIDRTNLNYATPVVSERWAETRQTHPAVAMAIHAIADSSRDAEAIWEAPTNAEWEHVTMAVDQYVAAGIFEAEDDGRYPWGEEAVVIN